MEKLLKQCNKNLHSKKNTKKHFRALTAYYSIGSLEAIGKKPSTIFLSNDGVIQNCLLEIQVDDERDT